MPQLSDVAPKRHRMAGEASHEEPSSLLVSCRRGIMNPAVNVAERSSRSDRLLNKWKVEERTSLDITTIYRKMKAGTFPQPVRVGRRRVAWRESDIAAWQAGLEVGTRL
jgi:prophage regulatory protein